LPQIVKDYVSTGKVKYVFSDFPLDSMHPQAFKAAEAAACAGDQGKFWEMHDQLFNNQQALNINALSLHAQAIGLNTAAFQQCLFGGKHEGKVRDSFKTGSDAGVSGTPTFFIGVTSSNSVKVHKILSGAQRYSAFKSVIENLLTSQSNERTKD
jgi:protein-disulfide isomerase